MLAHALSISLVYLDFQLRKDYIQKYLCINRNKPISMCGGQCYLVKQIKNTQQRRQSPENQINKKPNFEIICETLFHFDLMVFVLSKKEFWNYGDFYSKARPQKIFHPPEMFS